MGDVTYQLEGVKNNCVTINSKNGTITAVKNNGCGSDQTITVKATSKTGKTATAKLLLENDLGIGYKNEYYYSNDRVGDITSSEYYLITTLNVTWQVGCGGYDSRCVYKGKKSIGPSVFIGNFDVQPTPSSEVLQGAVKVTAKTAGGQSVSLVLTKKVN